MTSVEFWIYIALTALFSTYTEVHCGVKNALSAQNILHNRLDTQMSTRPSSSQYMSHSMHQSDRMRRIATVAQQFTSITQSL